MNKKAIAVALALVLVVTACVAGTLAWLTAKSDTVTNTFTASNIKVELKETKGVTVEKPNEGTFKMIPGEDISKDPKTKVLSGSEECWLFVKLEKSSNFDDFMTYTMADDWMQLKNGETDVAGVFYRKVQAADIGTEYSVLAEDKVSVKGTVTEAQMEALTESTYPTLTVTAYASQLKANGTEIPVYTAWTNIS